MNRFFLASVMVLAVTGCREPAEPVMEVLSAPILRKSVSNAGMTSSDALVTAWVTHAPDSTSSTGMAPFGTLTVMVDGIAPATIVDEASVPLVDSESPPQWTSTPDGAMYIAWSASSSPDQVWRSTGIRVAESTDGGRSWQVVGGPGGETAFGGYRNNHELTSGPDGTLYVAWLDSRYSSSDSYEVRMLVSRSEDGGRTWSDPVMPDSAATCECCRVALVAAPDGTLYVAWRKILDGGIRDIVMSSSTDGGLTWTAPVLVFEDGWVQDYCPDAGPALAVSENGTVHVAWWTGKEGAAGVKYVRSLDGGNSFSSPILSETADQSAASHVQLATSGNTVHLVFDDGRITPPRIAHAVSRDGGARFGSMEYVSPAGVLATYPHLAAGGEAAVIVWNERPDCTQADPSPMHANWAPYSPSSTMRVVRTHVATP